MNILKLNKIKRALYKLFDKLQDEFTFDYYTCYMRDIYIYWCKYHTCWIVPYFNPILKIYYKIHCSDLYMYWYMVTSISTVILKWFLSLCNYTILNYARVLFFVSGCNNFIASTSFTKLGLGSLSHTCKPLQHHLFYFREGAQSATWQKNLIT